MADLTARGLLGRAAGIISSADRYSAKHAASLADGTPTITIDPFASRFSVTGALERAATERVSGTDKLLRPTHRRQLAEAKAILCLGLKAMHLDGWEREQRPSWERVRQVFRAAGAGGRSKTSRRRFS